MQSHGRPLEGLRAIALEHAVAAPLCSRHLADMGCDVVKIERPGAGDFARDYDNFVHGQSSHFVWLNRGKRSLTLDVKQPAAKDALLRLVRTSDILLQNLAPGAAARLGLSHEALKPINPKLVVADMVTVGDDPGEGCRLGEGDADVLEVHPEPEAERVRLVDHVRGAVADHPENLRRMLASGRGPANLGRSGCGSVRRMSR